MDRIDAMRLFVRIVERRSFTLAARDLDLPRSTATEVVKQLESRLGVRLLQRTTRHVAPTLDGDAYYRHCVKVVAEIEEAKPSFPVPSPEAFCTSTSTVLWPGTSCFRDCLAFSSAIPISSCLSARVTGSLIWSGRALIAC